MNDITIVELPTNLGLKALSSDKEPGVKKLPAWLSEHEFHSQISHKTVETVIPPTYRMELDSQSGILNADSIADYAKQHSRLLTDLLQENTFPIVLGGDCSILLGNAIALKKGGDYALFYLDGHTDFVKLDQSKTKAVAGMVAALVAGIGDKKLTNIYNLSPYFEEENIWCVGNREYDDSYEQLIKASQCEYLTLDKFRETGIGKNISAFLKNLNEKQLNGFWLHIDVDVLNDKLMPSVDSRHPGGLSYQEFNKTIKLLLLSPHITGIEITILDPDLDNNGKYTKKFVENFCQAFNSVS